jgi:hypothetical protein
LTRLGKVFVALLLTRCYLIQQLLIIFLQLATGRLEGSDIHLQLSLDLVGRFDDVAELVSKGRPTSLCEVHECNLL